MSNDKLKLKEPSATFDPHGGTFHLERPGVSQTFHTQNPIPHLITLKLAWSVVDLSTGATIPASDGGHFVSVPGHKYNIQVTATDSHGVQTMALSGSGSFTIASDQDGAPQIEHEPISIEPESFTNTNVLAPTSRTLQVVMHPDIGGFDYGQLSAGFKKRGAMKEAAEFFAVSGTMTFTAQATDRQNGDVVTTSLSTSR